MTNKLYVGNLPYNVDDHSLGDIFAGVGTVDSARVITERDTGRSKGFGFVEMSTEEEAQSAVESLNETEVGGRRISVSEARPQTDRGGFGGGGGNRRGGGFGGGRDRY